ncbi:hypothetical protein FKW77_008633 [Venturia effusa]|uniref:Uncharacterized protein n=1 Tax=Venturia effusa TaxID=50376 RepID=A0A517L9T0_9PEZI|nr:hypothetical protein FKW77_008633 [Venturia effusa]
MARSYFETITSARRESYIVHRHSFDSDQTLVDSPQIQNPATLQTSSRPSYNRSTSTLTTRTASSTNALSPSLGKRMKVKRFFKRIGSGMLESLAFTGGAGIEYINTGIPTGIVVDKRSNDQVMGDVYGVQLMIW